MDLKQLRMHFKKETGLSWVNSQGEPDIEYVEWLENKVITKPNGWSVK